MNETITNIPLGELHPFPDHPFGVRDDEAMEQTVGSIREYGVLVPAIARPREEGGYELTKAAPEERPALVEELRKPPEERKRLLPERHLLTLEEIAAELPSEGCRGTPESMLYELEDALDTFFFRWSVCLSHNKDYFLAKKHNPKVNKLAQNGLAYLNRILKGEIPL